MKILTSEQRTLIEATQAGLPVVPEPYAELAARLVMSENEVRGHLQHLTEQGVIRRIAAAPNHFALGLVANGMTVWDVEDKQVSALGTRIGNLAYVTHCYLRPRALPDWPYNLFAMVHGTSRNEVEQKRTEIARILGASCRQSDILYSKRILKKTGLRLLSRGS